MAQHLSIRVPWHDNGYNGDICKKPCLNNSCLRLKNIAENRDDEFEQALAGCSMNGNEEKIPCLSEGGAFLSSRKLGKKTIHPYKKSNPKTHGHFLETEQVYPPYVLPARPFRWLMKADHYPMANYYNIDYDEDREPELKFNSTWIQDARNHKAIFDYFYHNVIPYQSLCVAYAKQVPFIEDHRRIVIGLGFVDKIIPAIEHMHTDNGELRSMTWETMICHTIRKDRKEGFLFPYNELMRYAENHPEFDISRATVFVSDEFFDEFSYATEHLSFDAVIDVLLQSLKALDVIKDCLDGDWNTCIQWVSARLTEVWQDRGAYPGAGAMLCAAGFQFGILIDEEVKNDLQADEDFWGRLDQAITLPAKYLSEDVAASITPLNQKTWKGLRSERKTLFKLLARISLTLDQAYTLFNVEERERYNLKCTDREIVENPYILYEKTRDKVAWLQVSVRKVDRAVFPVLAIQQAFPLPAPSGLTSENDERRIRAIAVSWLEEQAENGHTIYPCNNLLRDINDLPIDPKCNVSGDIMETIADFLSAELAITPMKKEGNAYQLVRLQEIDEVIRNVVSKRVNSSKRHMIPENWQSIVDIAFGKVQDDLELKARKEKVAVLKELAESRLSALIGGAGTGKTTLLALLCRSRKIQDGGILLLAPTGKARVKMSQAMQMQNVSCQAKTVAQFLMQNKRFSLDTMRYQLSDVSAKDIPETVIIDECSMLTEEMFGALLQSLRMAKRIILVGDPHQLPPIGAGRPFVDLIRDLSKDVPAGKFPKVSRSYGELQITRRQKTAKNGSERLDTELAKWYIDDPRHLDEDIFEKLQGNKGAPYVSFKTWKTNEELETCLLETLAEELNMKDSEDQTGFDRSLGGNIVSNGTYFNVGCAASADDWQILAPVRGMPYGVLSVNHLLHKKYREDLLDLATRIFQKKIPSAMGAENIVYGDKVINVINQSRNAYSYEQKEAIKGYVANGEIGIAAGSFGKSTRYLNVEFSSQKGITYSYQKKDFGEEAEAALELAYALTIHKAQGSEFKKVILILNEPCNLISKELLYTAITRQTERLVILYNDEAYHLRNYTTSACSEIARRFTNLFDEPEIVVVNDKYYEANLIHKTMRGEMVRSKSEVIIANRLYDNHVDYEYEKELRLDGILKIPDFTIDDPESGELIYWEHCGMMSDPKYREKWEAKKIFYERHGIVEGENLIVTYDDENGGVDSQVIQKYIDQYFG